MAAEPPTPAQAAAEARWRAAVEAQREDLERLATYWPDHGTPEAQAVLERMRARSAPGGLVDAAVTALDAAYGGPEAVPEPVRRRLSRYLLHRLRLKAPPWPETEDR